LFYFQIYKARHTSVHCVFRRSFQTLRRVVPPQQVRRVGTCIRLRALQRQEIVVPRAAGGEPGPCGPRTGSSSGVRPGSSSGRGGSPGSCSGGGTSGRGFPGGFSCGGSDGCPGWIGGSSCGSIGILLSPSFHVDQSTIRRRQCSGRLERHAQCCENSAVDQQSIMRKAPGIRRAGSARPPRRRPDHACEWRCSPTRAQRSRRSL
jgi:hypothetical protein